MAKNIDHTIKDIPLVAESEAMRRLLHTITQIAPTDVTVLIQGESGTGKEMVARKIHAQSNRKNHPFVAVNCAALPESILESELFGHEKGAFTDAHEQRQGRFELARGGTLFLDEIGEMSPKTQVKLLRVLEEKELMRLGGTRPFKTDVRILAATNKDLETAMVQNEFRKDLYYRLKVVDVKIAPLRERPEDIPVLIDTFIGEFCSQNNLDFPGFTPEALEALRNYSWPGNVRELQNLIKNLIILSPDKKIDNDHIPRYLLESGGPDPDRQLPVRINKSPEQAERELIYRAILDIKADMQELKAALTNAPIKDRPVDTEEPQSLAVMEKDLIGRTLVSVNYNKKQAAEKLGIGLRTIYRKIRKYALE